MHFFNPADRMKLVEVIAGVNTPQDVLEAKIHSGFAILSSSANVVFLTPISSNAASTN